MELYDVMRTTPATRQFTGEPVPDEVLYRMFDAARFAPSGGNRQPWRFVIVRDAALRQVVQRSYQLAWREYMAFVEAGMVPFAPVVESPRAGAAAADRPTIDLAAAREISRPDDFGDHLATVPVMLVLCARLASLAVTDQGLGRQSIVGGASVYPVAHNLLLAARNEGLGGVMTTVVCRQERAVKQALQIPDDYAVAALLALGRPVREITRLRRRPVAELVFVDHFGSEAFVV